ncbi:MAG: putative transport system permease protein [Actinomycetota bacterium]|jgi:hypothetical protein|nr:putative transport system permease protein [Actinomycetota bacterium]
MLSLIVAAVTGVVLAFAGGAARTASAPDRYTAASGGGFDGEIVQEEGAAPRTAEVASLPGAASVDALTFVFGALTTPEGEPVDAVIFAGSYRSLGLRMLGGREPDPGVVGEIVITRALADAHGADLGDRFSLVTLTQEQADSVGFQAFEQGPGGPTIDAVIVGIVDGVAILNDPDFSAIAVVQPTLLDDPVIGISNTVMSVRLRPATDLADFRSQLDTLPDGETLRLEPAELISAEVRRAVEGQARGLWVLTAVVALAAIVVLGQLITREIRVAGDEGSPLRALGYGKGQLLVERLARAAVPVGVGTVLGAGLAVGLSGLFPNGFVRRIEPYPGIRVDAAVLGLGMAALALALLAWVFTVLLLARSAAQGERPSALVESVASRFPSAALATGFRFAFTRGRRDRGSVLGSVAGMVATAALLVGAVVFGSSLSRLIDDGSRYGNTFDLTYGSGGDVVPDEVRASLEADDDVEGLILYAAGSGRVGAVTLGLAAMVPVKGDLGPRLHAGRLPNADDEIALGRLVAHTLGAKVGGVVTVEGESGAQSYRVTGLAVVPGIEGMPGVGQDSVVTMAGLGRLEPEAQPSFAAITLRPGADPARFAELGLGGNNSAPTSIVNLARLRSVPFVLAWILALLAVLTTVHVMVTSVRNRRRDVAVLRSLGADGRWLTKAVHWQATAFSLLPLTLGVPLGISLGRLVFEPFAEHVGVVPDASFPFALLAAVTVGVVALANAAATVPARRARRLAPAPLLAAE